MMATRHTDREVMFLMRVEGTVFAPDQTGLLNSRLCKGQLVVKDTQVVGEMRVVRHSRQGLPTEELRGTVTRAKAAAT